MNTYTSSNLQTAPVVERVLLPTQIIEKTPAIHEEIRKEMIEEIQPVMNVEKLKTEVHQVTQPLFDKEVRPVLITEKTLNTEILPEVLVEGRGMRTVDDVSTTRFVDTATVVVEKPAIFTEVERKQIIEEIQPVIYKETIVPTVIQETKPIYQKIVEGPVYTQNSLPMRQVAQPSLIAETYVTDRTVVAPINERVLLPTKVIEKQAAVHEEIRRENIEEIQPVVNIEKLQTEIHQITAPLFDKEIKPVLIEKKILAQEILPEVQLQGRGLRAVDDFSTTKFLNTATVVVEKPAIVNEVERTQIIEEIQPVVYKETIVPTVIRETKPIYQKIVEGPVYSHQTLPARSLHETNYRYPTVSAPILEPVREAVVVTPIAVIETPTREIIVEEPIAIVNQVPSSLHKKEIVEETVTTTTTTTTAPVVPIQHRGLFHRHSSTNNTAPVVNNSLNNSNFVQTTSSVLPGSTRSFHNESIGQSGEKIITDTTTTHSETILPARAL